MESIDILADHYFAERLDTTLETLLMPIAGDSPAGESLTSSETYSSIRDAREEEEATLPLGQWEHELKRADRGAASRSCVHALSVKSKDLQLAAWMLEAEIHRHGFAALAPCLTLIGALTRTYWRQLYPQNIERRDNIFRWIDDKLNRLLRLVPFTATGSGVGYGWADWEQS